MLKKLSLAIYVSFFSFSVFSGEIKCSLYDGTGLQNFSKKVDESDSTFLHIGNLEGLDGIEIIVTVGRKNHTLKQIFFHDEKFGVNNVYVNENDSGPNTSKKQFIIAYPRGEKRLFLNMNCEIDLSK